MKIWMRYLLGTAVGIAIGVLLPLAGGDSVAILQGLSSLVVRLGRLFLFPLVFFAAIVAMDELREDRRVLRTLGTTAVITVVAVLFAVILGSVAILVLQPARIPPMVQESRAMAAPRLLPQLLETVPGNLFRVFVAGDNALFMILLVGMMVGLTLRFDREITSPVSLVADSANRILYRLNAWVVEGIGFLLAVPAATVVVRTRSIEDLALFGQFLLVVASAALFIGVVVYPLVLFLLDRERSEPLSWLHRMTPAGVSAVVTGDVFLSLATALRMNKENLGIPRRIGGSMTPLVAIFGRAGTAMVSVASFLLVIRSYTALEIGFGDVLSLMVSGVAYSVLLGRHPAGAVMLLMSYLAVRYGRGMEESYLILLPVMAVLERIGAWLDVMTVGFASQLVSRRGRFARAVDRTV